MPWKWHSSLPPTHCWLDPGHMVQLTAREGGKCSLVMTLRRRENGFVDYLASYHMDLVGFITVNIICLLNLISVIKLIIIGKVW